jgi:hypothetical protein
MATFRKTPTSNYALGRETTVTLWFKDPNTSAQNVSFDICISQGSVSIDTDTIEVPSNCQAGWKIKLPGLKGGTISATGYIASSQITGLNTDTAAIATANSTTDSLLNIMQYLSQPCGVVILAHNYNAAGYTGNVSANSPGDMPLRVAYKSSNPYNGFLKSCNVSISPDDAVKIDFSIELSGESELRGLMAIAVGQNGTAAV